MLAWLGSWLVRFRYVILDRYSPMGQKKLPKKLYWLKEKSTHPPVVSTQLGLGLAFF